MKAKRLVALMLAVVMIVGLFAMAAVAHPNITCYACYNLDQNGKRFTDYSYGSWNAVNPQRVSGCSQMSGYHYHYDRYRRVSEVCSKHGLLNSYDEWEYNICYGG